MRALGGFFAFIVVVSLLLIGAMYVWTIVVAANTDGFWAAALAFLLPIIMQIYWTITVWATTGFDTYCLLSTIALGITALFWIIGGIAKAAND